MAKTRIYCPDIECESCVKVLDRTLKKTEGILDVKIHNDSLDIDYDKERIDEKKIMRAIEQKGYRASTTPFERKTMNERLRDFRENKKEYQVEWKVISYALSIFLIITIIEAILYFAFLKSIPGFLDKYAWWLLYLNIGISTLTMAIWHVKAYKGNVTCMTGMMIGMTIGMQSGMMIGAIIGATNGFFIGAMTGMLLGVTVGIITGKCCGTMGWLQGMMAGVMGGTMGPMISVMMFSDHLLVFMPVYIIINVAILWGMSVMVYEEIAEGKKVERVPADMITTASIAVIATSVLLAIIAFAPKSAFIGA